MTANKPEKKKAVRFLFLVLGLAALIHSIFFYALSSGKILRVLRVIDRPDYAAQKQMWMLKRERRQFNSLFIGDDQFIEKIRSQHPACDCRFVTIPYYQFINIGESLKLLTKNQFKNIFIQNEPHFWTNLGHGNPVFYMKQNVEILSNHIRFKNIKNIASTIAEKTIFNMPKQLLTPLPDTMPLPIEAKHLELLWFRAEPKYLYTIKNFHKRFDTSRFFWVTDMSFNFKSKTGLDKELKKFSTMDKIGPGKFIDNADVDKLMKEK